MEIHSNRRLPNHRFRISNPFKNIKIKSLPSKETQLNQTNQISISIEIYYILSFIFFRFFDILKPFPVSYFDKNHKNYFGIIMDDIMAGLYSMIIIYLFALKF